MTASDIIDLLAEKHAPDLFVPECKIGPTWTGKPLRLDGWAMKKSWANPRYIGYEVKVSRSDFLADKKWRDYLPFCSEFSFVCPKGLIAPEEIPEGIGLIYASDKGLTTKVVAKRVGIQFPESVAHYILMSRASILKGSHKIDGINRHLALADRHLIHLAGRKARKRIAELEQERQRNALLISMLTSCAEIHGHEKNARGAHDLLDSLRSSVLVPAVKFHPTMIGAYIEELEARRKR